MPTAISSPRCCTASRPAAERISIFRCLNRWSNGWVIRCTMPSPARHRPQLRARKRWRDVESPAGSILALLPPGSSQVADEASARMDPVPALGEHTDAILAELGCSGPEIAELRAAHAV